MDDRKQRIESAISALEAQRAALALDLMDSVTAPNPRDESAWIEEIERRAQRALSGTDPYVDVDDAVDRISRDLAL